MLRQITVGLSATPYFAGSKDRCYKWIDGPGVDKQHCSLI